MIKSRWMNTSRAMGEDILGYVERLPGFIDESCAAPRLGRYLWHSLPITAKIPTIMFQSFSASIAKYATFSGRATRKEFWQFILVSIILSALVGVFHGENSTLAGVLEVLLFVPTLAAAARRLQDLGHSGWWLLVAPTGIGAIILFFVMMKAGQPYDNAYGPDPEGYYGEDDQTDAWYHQPRRDRGPAQPVPRYNEDQYV